MGGKQTLLLVTIQSNPIRTRVDSSLKSTSHGKFKAVHLASSTRYIIVMRNPLLGRQTNVCSTQKKAGVHLSRFVGCGLSPDTQLVLLSTYVDNDAADFVPLCELLPNASQDLYHIPSLH